MTLDTAHPKHPHTDDHTPVLSPVQRQAVQEALEAILSSAPMRSTLQCQALLQYIVEHTLSGELSLLRERVIGREVFGRRADYEPGEDPVVRIRAADLRKRLALYYQSLHVIPDVRVDVPSGSYKASFTWRADTPPTAITSTALHPEHSPETPAFETPSFIGNLPLAPHAETSVIPPDQDSVAHAPLPQRVHSSFHYKKIALLIFCAVLIAGLMAAANWYRGRSDRILRTFWAPVLDSPKSALLSIGSNAVYRVSDEKADEYSRRNHLENSGMEFFPQFDSNQTIISTGLHPAENSFVALGDVASVSEVVGTLAHFNKGYQERFPNDVSFAEVRNNPTVLIGGFNNPMTRELTRNFRFVLSARNRIEDRQEPGKAWVLNASTDSHDTEDFAIITRVLRHDEDEPMVSVAGMGQYGTLAATDFVCKPEAIRQLSAALGKDGLRKNFQVVLRIKIMDFKPTSTSIVATHIW